MCSVPIEGVRVPLTIDRLRYVERLPGWACIWPYGMREIELQISGNEGSLDGRLLALAELLLPHLEPLEAAAGRLPAIVFHAHGPV